MLLDLGLMPIIRKPARKTNHTSTLIDHIYTNTPEKVIKTGICLADISDPLPVFCAMANNLSTSNEPRYFRNFANFNEDAFLQELSSVYFSNLITNDSNESMSNIVEKLRKITDRHAPVRKASKLKRKRLEKLWITKAILVFIKRKQNFSKLTI